MDRQSFLLLTSSSQWILFAGLGLIIYSMIEPKKIIHQASQIVFIVLGLFSAWIIFSGQIIVPAISPGDTTPAEAKALTYFHGLLLTGILGILGLIMPKLNPKWVKFPNLIIIPVGLILFFMVYRLQKQ